MRGPKVVIYPDKAGEYRWRLVAGNGEIQASGEGFETEEGAHDSVNAVARNFAALLPEDWAVAEGIEPGDKLAIDPEYIEVITTKAAAEFDEGVR